MKKYNFIYTDEVINCHSEQDLAVYINPNIHSKQDLLEWYATNLNFPKYFSFNWDSFQDCLRGLEWIKQKRVLLVHKGVPKLSHEDIKNYIDILNVAVDSWKPEEYHELNVIFPVGCKSVLDKL